MRKYIYDTTSNNIHEVYYVSSEGAYQSPYGTFWIADDDLYKSTNTHKITQELFMGDKGEEILAQLKADFPKEAEMFRDYFAHRVMYDFENSANTDEREYYEQIDLIKGINQHSSALAQKKLLTTGEILSKSSPESKIEFTKGVIFAKKVICMPKEEVLYKTVRANELVDFMNSLHWWNTTCNAPKENPNDYPFA
jgi:hypothetical protein